jgi:hypothetical protein
LLSAREITPSANSPVLEFAAEEAEEGDQGHAAMPSILGKAAEEAEKVDQASGVAILSAHGFVAEEEAGRPFEQG